MAKIQKIYPELSSWEEFVKEYNKNHNEYTFKYNNFYIRLDYNKDGTKFVIYRIKEEEYTKSFFWKIFHKIEAIDYQEFSTTEELTSKAIIDGKLFKDIFEELE